MSTTIGSGLVAASSARPIGRERLSGAAGRDPVGVLSGWRGAAEFLERGEQLGGPATVVPQV